MFGKHFTFVNDDTNAIIASNIIAKSNEKLGEKLESIAKDEIKSKDRVNITLDEYLNMRQRIEMLERQNSQMGKTIAQLGIPIEVIYSINHESICVTHCDDIRDFVRHYRIVFDVDATPDLKKWRYEY